MCIALEEHTNQSAIPILIIYCNISDRISSSLVERQCRDRADDHAVARSHTGKMPRARERTTSRKSYGI
jgi:hypothetical protein